MQRFSTIVDILVMLLFDEQINENRFSTGSCLSNLTPGNAAATSRMCSSCSTRYMYVYM